MQSTPVHASRLDADASSSSSPPPTPLRPPPPRPPIVTTSNQSVGAGPPPYVAPASAQWYGPFPRQHTQPPPPPSLQSVTVAQNYSQFQTHPPPSPQFVQPPAPIEGPISAHTHGTLHAPIPSNQPQLHLTQQTPHNAQNSFISLPGSPPTTQGLSVHAAAQVHIRGPASAPRPPPPPSIPPPDLLGEDDLPVSVIGVSANHVSLAPPRPPNPELLRIHTILAQKLQDALTSMSANSAETTARQHAIQRDLLAGGPAIRDEMGRLVAVRDVCRVVSGRMREVVRQAEGNLVEIRRKGEPEVDELVCSTSIVHNQSVTSLAPSASLPCFGAWTVGCCSFP